MTEKICPSCSGELDRCEDELGVTYQCRDLSCMELFDESEIIDLDQLSMEAVESPLWEGE